MSVNVEVSRFLIPTDYAQGTFLGEDPTVQDLSPRDQAYVAAWRHGCPRPDEVINYYGQEWLAWRRREHDLTDYSPARLEEEGIQLTLRRYSECDFVYGIIKEAVLNAINNGLPRRDLYVQLNGLEPRQPDEPLGYTEEGRVPDLAREVRPPLSRLVGYALPRVLIEGFGWGFGVERDWDQYARTLSLLDGAIKQASSPEQLLAVLANKVVAKGADPEIIIDHILTPGIEEEQNNHREYARVRAAIRRHAPNLRPHLQE